MLIFPVFCQDWGILEDRKIRIAGTDKEYFF
jgi:hypothetical protein